MGNHPESERADEFKGQKGGGARDHEEWRQVPSTQRPWHRVCLLCLRTKGGVLLGEGQ